MQRDSSRTWKDHWTIYVRTCEGLSKVRDREAQRKKAQSSERWKRETQPGLQWDLGNKVERPTRNDSWFSWVNWAQSGRSWQERLQLKPWVRMQPLSPERNADWEEGAVTRENWKRKWAQEQEERPEEKGTGRATGNHRGSLTSDCSPAIPGQGFKRKTGVSTVTDNRDMSDSGMSDWGQSCSTSGLWLLSVSQLLSVILQANYSALLSFRCLTCKMGVGGSNCTCFTGCQETR